MTRGIPSRYFYSSFFLIDLVVTGFVCFLLLRLRLTFFPFFFFLLVYGCLVTFGWLVIRLIYRLWFVCLLPGCLVVLAVDRVCYVR